MTAVVLAAEVSALTDLGQRSGAYSAAQVRYMYEYRPNEVTFSAPRGSCEHQALPDGFPPRHSTFPPRHLAGHHSPYV